MGKRPTASAAFQIMPRASDQEETIAIIDKVIAAIKASGVTYEVGKYGGSYDY